MSIDYSWHRRAQDSIAQNYLTNSKRPQSHILGVVPSHIVRGEGCFLWDHTGKKYMDFVTGLGANLLGYGNQTISRAMAEWLTKGFSHSLATTLEVETAEKLKECMPFVDCFKFLKSGSEACSAAVKIARASTGRTYVLSDGYHGWHDDFVALTDPALGVPREPRFPRAINTLKRLDQVSPILAAVIVEPVITDHSEARRAYLQTLREACTKYGVMLIFDEVITGMRWPKFSVAGLWNIVPDLIVLGKGLANGMPLAAVGGKYPVMNCDYFVSSTYAGETLSLAAAKASIIALHTKHDLQWLWDKGTAFWKKFNEAAFGVVSFEGYPTRGKLVGATTAKALFLQESCKAGLLFNASPFFNFPLAEAAFDALGAISALCQQIRQGEVVLEGELPAMPFAQKVREKQ